MTTKAFKVTTKKTAKKQPQKTTERQQLFTHVSYSIVRLSIVTEDIWRMVFTEVC